MPSRLGPVLLSCAALALAVSPAAPALALTGPVLPSGMVHHDSSAWSLVHTTNKPRSTLNGVSCVSATDCTAVGSVHGMHGTLVESWNGTAWSVVPSPNPSPGVNALSAVSCVSATACTAVGGSISKGAQTTVVESWNGTAWSVVPSPNAAGTGSILVAVSCASATACTAVGQYVNAQDMIRTLVESWNGTAWSVVPSPNKDSGEDILHGVSCVSATACTAVGSGGVSTRTTLVESWDGTAWSVVPSPNKGSADDNVLSGVSCVSATACTAVGRYLSNHGDGFRTLVESWNGTAWSVVPTPNKVGGDNRDYLDGVSCVPDTACNAVGLYQKLNTSGAEETKTLAESNDVVPSSR